MDEEILKNAQYRKGLSIAFFNATNAAISLVAGRQIADREEALREIVRLRDFFLEEHKNYYAQVIAKVGVNYDAKQTIEKLKETKSIEELNSAWLSLSEDERRDGEIRKFAQSMKKSHEKV